MSCREIEEERPLESGNVCNVVQLQPAGGNGPRGTPTAAGGVPALEIVPFSPDAPTSAGAPRRTGRPSALVRACTDTTAPATGGRGARMPEPIRASRGWAIRRPSTRKEENCDKAQSLGKRATASAKAASASSDTAPSRPMVTTRPPHLPL